ncbi:hypothetical protein F5144DRAFT_503846 [Chaetomium tenue]|uniref:Uncharacterized protein n=1 Tax=Chaetomium tenue TaxID=1854479 RepID=A0ACB7PQ73_9PEZI|nr:hypothetical protein F5144DRAFT_503846 [Chaetomium globosum]
MVLPTCFVVIPALPSIVTLPKGSDRATFAYAPTHTDYVGATLCGLSSTVTKTPFVWDEPTLKAKCSLPASVSGKAYFVTPVIFVPRSVSSTPRHTFYDCDPIPAASMNKGDFPFACKSLLGKDMGTGYHTISWMLPTAAGIFIRPFTFHVTTPTSTPEYVINTSLAMTTLVPRTEVVATVTTPTTWTAASTTTVTIYTYTYTCTVTVTVTPMPGPRLRRAEADVNLQPDPKLALPTDTDNSADTAMDLERRAAATPKMGKPDFTYPPFGVTTIYVKSISTSTYTNYIPSTVWVTAPDVTITTSRGSFITSTVTVTATPVVGWGQVGP